MKRVTITMYLNTDDGQEAWDIVDEWIGTTAPEDTDSFSVDVEDES